MNVFYPHFITMLVERLKRKYDVPGSRISAKANGKDEKTLTTEASTEQTKTETQTENPEEKKEGDKDKETKEKSEKKEAETEGVCGRADLSAGFVQNNVCEMLSYCIRHHGYRIKYFLLGGSAVQKVLKLLDHRDTFLVLGIYLSPLYHDIVVLTISSSGHTVFQDICRRQ